MKREFLESLDLGKGVKMPKSAIDAIMNENGNDIEAARKPFSDYESIKQQLSDANKTIEDFKNMDVDGIKKAADEWKAKYEQAEKDHAAKLDGLELDGKIESALRDAKAKNAKAVRALLDMEALKSSKNRDADIKAAVEAVAAENAFLFGEDGGGPRLSSGSHHGPGGEPDYSKMSDEEYYAATMKKE